MGALLGVPVTVASAWRWRLVARGLGADLPLGRATAACYRSQFLNSVLPGGVLGDVHRGVDHGRVVGDPARGLRSVAWERTAGQLVQASLAVLVLLLLPSPVRSTLPGMLTLLVVVVVLLGALVRSWSTLRADLAMLLARRIWPGVVVASAVVVAGLVTTYVVAARAVGVTAPLSTLVPLAVLVLVAAALPANLAGWGPREGMAAWALRGRRPGRRAGAGRVGRLRRHGGGRRPPRGRRARWSGRARADERGSRSMAERPYTILSCGISIDGYLDAATPERLVLSNDDDLRRVDAVRADVDAILVGAETVRHDNPRLLVRDARLRECRRARGLGEHPMKVTVTRGGRLDPTASFFSTGDCEKVVYCERAGVAAARARLGSVATVVDGGAPVDVRTPDRGPLRAAAYAG